MASGAALRPSSAVVLMSGTSPAWLWLPASLGGSPVPIVVVHPPRSLHPRDAGCSTSSLSQLEPDSEAVCMACVVCLPPPQTAEYQSGISVNSGSPHSSVRRGFLTCSEPTHFRLASIAPLWLSGGLISSHSGPETGPCCPTPIVAVDRAVQPKSLQHSRNVRPSGVHANLQ